MSFWNVSQAALRLFLICVMAALVEELKSFQTFLRASFLPAALPSRYNCLSPAVLELRAAFMAVVLASNADCMALSLLSRATPAHTPLSALVELPLVIDPVTTDSAEAVANIDNTPMVAIIFFIVVYI